MTRSRRGPEPRLSHAVVLDAARRIPPSDLTMRALGRELGVTHGALYRYFPDLKSVLATLAAQVAETMAPPPADLPWDEWLRQSARAVRQVIQQHPDLVDPATWAASTPATHHMLTVGMTVLRRTFSPSDSLVALGAVSRFATGFASSEPAMRHPSTAPLPDALLEVLVGADVVDDPDVLFERELDIVIAGIDATLPKLAGSRDR